MQKWKAILLVAAILVQSFYCPVMAREARFLETAAPVLDLSAKSAVVMEQESKEILFAKDKDKELAPASVTKIMSLLLIFEDLKQGKIKLTDTVTVSEHAASMGGSQVFLETGEKQQVQTLIKCVVISSANDAVVALAEHVCGSEEAFVSRMNKKARELGMKHTTFQNACGLDAKGHVTSAYDIALMTRELAQRYPEVFKYTKIWMDTIIHKTKKGEKEFGLSNTNKLIRQYHGCTGMKTGSTGKAGFCLSATATRNKIHMIAVVMGCESSKARIKDARTLLDYGFSNCQRIHSETTRKEIGRIPVQKGQRSEVSCQEKVTADLIDIKTQKGKIVKKIKIDSVKAPVKKGQKIGEIQYSKGNIMIHKEKILAQETINKADFLTQIKNFHSIFLDFKPFFVISPQNFFTMENERIKFFLDALYNERMKQRNTDSKEDYNERILVKS